MKKFYSLLILLACCSASFAQIFTDTDGAVIHDPPVVQYFPFAVSGLPSVADTVFDVVKVCCAITHFYDADLDIRLQARDGTIIKLSNNHGSSCNNYSGICFAEDATNGEIGSAYASFS